MLPTNAGSRFEQLTGVTIRDYQGSGVNRTYRLNDLVVNGMLAVLQPSRARVTARFDDGQVAATESALGRGRAVVLAYEAARMCFQPGQPVAERTLIQQVLGAEKPGYRCPGAIVYRLSSPTADHYFLINDGPAKTVSLTVSGPRYRAWTDAVTGKPLAANAPLSLEAHSGRWVRAEK